MQAMQAFRTTTWKNPTPHTVKFEIFEGPGIVHPIALEPGGSVQIPSIYDDAIQTVKNGVVFAGLAPQLKAEGRAAVPMHEALAKAAAMGDAERKLMHSTGITAGSASLDALSVLQAQIDELKKAKSSELDDLKAKLAAAEAKNAELEAMVTAPTKAEEPKRPSGGK